MSFRIKDVFFDDKNLPLSFYDEIDDNNYFTIIVGKNSSGKSRLLSSLVNTFESLSISHSSSTQRIRNNYDRKNDKRLNSFFVNYRHGIQSYSLGVSNGRLEVSFNEASLPSKILAVSTTPYDKFPLERKKSESRIYSYIGVRNHTNKISGLSPSLLLMSDFIYGLINSNFNKNKNEAIINVLEFLHFKPKLNITYKLNGYSMKLYDELFTGTYDYNDFSDKLGLLANKDRGLVFDHRKSVINEMLLLVKNKDDFCELRKAYDLFCRNIDYRNDNIAIDFNFNDIENNKFFIYQHYITILIEANIIKLSDINLISEKNEEVSVSDLSSGEQCIMSTMLSMISSIEDDSLICIDEPEISLHPEWQEKYIDLLFSTFKYCRGCHFIIATHSPQVTSRLNGDNCVILKINDQTISNALDSFQKSADYQLANLFSAPGMSNEYLTRECLTIIAKLSTGEYSSTELKEESQKLFEFRKLLKEKDPVSQLIDAIYMALNNKCELDNEDR